MNYSNKNEEIVNEIKKHFNCITLELKCIEFRGIIPAFFIKFNSEDELVNSWEKFTEFIAGNFQVNLISEFETWNIYLFFLVDKPIDKSLKYKIENDTFSSRKIVIESNSSNDDIISKHIFNNNLDLISKKDRIITQVPFVMNQIIKNALIGKSLGKKRTNRIATDDVLKEIENALKSQTNEI